MLGVAPSVFQKRNLFKFMPTLLFLFLWNGQQCIYILFNSIVFLGFGSCGFVFNKEPFLFCVEIGKLRFHLSVVGSGTAPSRFNSLVVASKKG